MTGVVIRSLTPSVRVHWGRPRLFLIRFQINRKCLFPALNLTSLKNSPIHDKIWSSSE